jgi:hypothetical protein
MKELHGSATQTLGATPEECTALLAIVDRYPSWYPEVIRDAEVLERGADGVPVRARTTVHVAVGPLVRDFQLLVTVAVEPRRQVTLTRVAHEATDPEQFQVKWLVEPGPQTRLSVELTARLDVPRFLPVGGIGDSLAQGFVDAASRALADSSPNASASSA